MTTSIQRLHDSAACPERWSMRTQKSMQQPGTIQIAKFGSRPEGSAWYDFHRSNPCPVVWWDILNGRTPLNNIASPLPYCCWVFGTPNIRHSWKSYLQNTQLRKHVCLRENLSRQSIKTRLSNFSEMLWAHSPSISGSFLHVCSKDLWSPVRSLDSTFALMSMWVKIKDAQSGFGGSVWTPLVHCILVRQGLIWVW